MTSFIFNLFVQYFSEGHFCNCYYYHYCICLSSQTFPRKTKIQKWDYPITQVHKNTNNQCTTKTKDKFRSKLFFIFKLILLFHYNFIIHFVCAFVHSNNLTFGDFKNPSLWRPLSVRTKWAQIIYKVVFFPQTYFSSIITHGPNLQYNLISLQIYQNSITYTVFLQIVSTETILF